ncbi:MAG TPA: hypothetical protein VGL77_11100 [Armatimonadota bacterium]|jgi:hypothetical protein
MAFLGGLFGGGDNHARDVGAIAAQMKKWWAMYQGPMLAQLAQQVNDPLSAYDRAQQRAFSAQTRHDYTQGQDQLRQAVAGRGGASSSSMGGYWRAYGHDMAKARAQTNQQIEARRQQSMGALLSQAGALGQQAMAGYQMAQAMSPTPIQYMTSLLSNANEGAAGWRKFLADD